MVILDLDKRSIAAALGLDADVEIFNALDKLAVTALFSKELVHKRDVVRRYRMEHIEYGVGVAADNTEHRRSVDALGSAGIWNGDGHDVFHDIAAAIYGTVLGYCTKRCTESCSSISYCYGLGASGSHSQFFVEQGNISIINFFFHPDTSHTRKSRVSFFMHRFCG